MELEALVRAAATGEQRAWTLLTRRLTPQLRAYFVSRCRGFDYGDLIQDTLIVVFRKLPNFEIRSEAAFKSWVFNIAQLLALTALRQSKRAAEVERELGQIQRTPSMKMSSRLDRAERIEMVMREVEKLPPSYRLAIENMLDNGRAKDLAELADIDTGSARVAKKRAYDRLRERLRPSSPFSQKQ